ncbi:DUF4387 family protein [Paraburkholderia fungorum]|uniref:DUF4387 family protein n=1 Tax=Paraburkholderia fungorum TaxID=134537 RepID=UPI0038BA12F7
MARLIYRVVSACGALGCGFPRESLQKALNGRVDAVIAAAGSPGVNQRYVGSGDPCAEREAVKDDLRKMVEAGDRIGAPVIIGSGVTAGGDRDLDRMLDIATEIFEELQVRGVKVAVIRSEVAPSIVIDELRAGALRPLGAGPTLDEAALRASTIVGQMGIHPLCAALASSAKYVFAGRSCSAALFAADMIRRGISPGLAYHVGHVLKYGARACETGSSSDCLVAEIYDDGSAVFVAPVESRHCTPYSIAAHSLYEQAHPQLQFYPEGVLNTAETEFFPVSALAAGIRRSAFYRIRRSWPPSIRLEGTRRRGSIHEWTIDHLLQNEEIIRDSLFPIHYYRVSGREWVGAGQARAEYFEVGELAGTQNLDARTLCVIEDVPPHGRPFRSRRLLEIACVFRSEGTGTGWLTIDVFFRSKEAYEMALLSNLFCARNLAIALGLKLKAITGSYFVDNCSAIKIAIEWPASSAALDGRDKFGAQQQAAIERLVVPMYGV